jgi:hypothetical protein
MRHACPRPHSRRKAKPSTRTSTDERAIPVNHTSEKRLYSSPIELLRKTFAMGASFEPPVRTFWVEAPRACATVRQRTMQ